MRRHSETIGRSCVGIQLGSNSVIRGGSIVTRIIRSTAAMAIVGLMASAAPATAQVTTATIIGTVRDGQGGVVPGTAVVLVSETLGTQMGEVFTNEAGEFVLANVRPDRYTVRISQDGFKTLERTGLTVSAGDRMGLGTLTIELGTLAETVMVTGEAPMLQTESGERSFSVPLETVQNLPIVDRSFIQLVTLTPGVGNTSVTGNSFNPGRIGGGGFNNIMMDGVSSMDTGNNGVMLQMNTESIAEVKILTSGYQAEFGRSSGLQITAITKSGTNQFSGSAYSVFRNSSWNANSKTNILNGDPISSLKEQDLGYSIGGPIGRPGGNNKLFFFYAHEYAPRTTSNAGGTVADIIRYRVPTALERQGDFSQSRDNNGNLFPFIKDPLLPGACAAGNTSGCFADGGVLGRIPANRLYDVGVNLLKMWPMPNVDVPGVGYNFETRPPEQSMLAMQPVFKIDYLPVQSVRTTFRYGGWRQQRKDVLGTLPGFNDTETYKPVVTTYAATASWTMTPTMFLEGTFGHAADDLNGCTLAQNNTGPVFCQNSIPVNPTSNRFNVGLGNFPYIYPDANIVPTDSYAHQVFTELEPPIWDGTRLQLVPSFANGWGSRIANANQPPNVPFPNYINLVRTYDVAINLTKVWGSHTIKTGFYRTQGLKKQQRQGWAGVISFANDTSNPLDSQFGFSNAALGVFSSYNQLSKYAEGDFRYNNTEFYIQDNWKASSKLSLAYGARFVHQAPQTDAKGQAVNFLPDQWNQGQAPLLYVAGCANGVSPCSGTNRQAMHPVTQQFLGPTSAGAIGTVVPGTGNTLNGLFVQGQGIDFSTYRWPALAVAPRVGLAYDMSGNQQFILRGSTGVYFDRPSGNNTFNLIQNPPTLVNATVRYGTLQSISGSGATLPAPVLNAFQYEMDLPTSVQWNGGFQMMLPWSSSVDFEYVGQHSYNTLRPGAVDVNANVNAIDFGAAFLPQYQDATLAPNATPGARAVTSDLMRAYKGYGTITMNGPFDWRTFHSLQLSFNRRFRNGFSFGFNDTIVLSRPPEHPAAVRSPERWVVRPARRSGRVRRPAGNVHPQPAGLQGRASCGTFQTWVRAPAGNGILAAIVNDWQISGVFTGQTGTTYDVGFTYQSGGGNINLTGSPDYPARVRIVGDPGNGCSDDPSRQFNTSAFQGPLSGSVGLDSRANVLTGCFEKNIDLSIARNVGIGGGRLLQFRVDLFNAFNFAGITGRNTTLALTSPNDPVTATNLPYDAAGNPIAARLRPAGAGFGVANAYQLPRRVQAYLRFSF